MLTFCRGWLSHHTSVLERVTSVPKHQQVRGNALSLQTVKKTREKFPADDILYLFHIVIGELVPKQHIVLLQVQDPVLPESIEGYFQSTIIFCVGVYIHTLLSWRL